jgi:[acyl-carrier-protein] S-malonyltransferase
MTAATAVATAWIFPGQGSQKVGMGRAWAERFPVAHAVFDEASEALGSTSRRSAGRAPRASSSSPPTRSRRSSPLGRHRGCCAARLAPAAVAGHSLGEYSAHVAAGTLTLADAVRLVRRRGELMQEAVPVA